MDAAYTLANGTDVGTVNRTSCYDYGKQLHNILYQVTAINDSRYVYIFNNYTTYRLYQRTRYHLYFHFYPILYVIGVPGNVISAALWLHPLLRTTTGVYFAVLAISDTLVLAFHLKFIVEVAMGDLQIIRSNVACKIFNSLLTASDCLSVVLVLAITVERFVVVCYPMHRKRLCSMRRTYGVICALVAFAGGVGVVEGVLWNYDEQLMTCATGRGQIETKHAVEASNLAIVSVAFLSPILALLVLDLRIILRIRKSRIFRMEFTRRTNAAAAAVAERRAPLLRKQIERDNSYILLVLSFYVALSKTPESICYFLLAYFLPIVCDSPYTDDGRPAWERYFRFLLVSSVLQAFSLTNYAINCWVYSLLGRKFRATIRTVVCGKRNATNLYSTSG